jgi:hypothetical protein
VLEARSIGSTPELFRNFSCGTIVFLFAFFSERSLESLRIVIELDEIIGQFIGIQILVVTLLVFSLYTVGVVCVLLGETAFLIFPGRFLEVELETQARVLKSGNAELVRSSLQLQQGMDNLHAGVGLGILAAAATAGMIGRDFSLEHVDLIAFLLSITIIASLRRIWVAYRFRKLVDLVLGGQNSAPTNEEEGSVEGGAPIAQVRAQEGDDR